jgi:hypothetical protein
VLSIVNRLLPSPAGTAGHTERGLRPAATAGQIITALTRPNRRAGHQLNQPQP